MTDALLLAITMITGIGAAARLTRLVSADTLTEPLRQRATGLIRDAHPAWRRYNTEFEAYRETVTTALDQGHPVPTDAPHPPEEPTLITLIHCRWCAGMWTSLLTVTAARLLLTTNHPPLWTAWPLTAADLLLIPAWALATAYAVGYLANREGE